MISRELLIHRAWISLSAIIIIFMIYVIGRNLFHALSIRSDISALEYEADYYRNHIKADSILLEKLKYDDNLEKYAREKYHMQRRGESVYFIE